jgi:hypothetical protein
LLANGTFKRSNLLNHKWPKVSGALNELKELLGDAVTLVIETIETPEILCINLAL